MTNKTRDLIAIIIAITILFAIALYSSNVGGERISNYNTNQIVKGEHT